MREIRFRAWDKKNNKMREVIAIYFDKELGNSIEIFDSLIDSDPYNFPGEKEVRTIILEEDEYELMQYVGLRDKNGKEIYEGDICEREYFLRSTHRGGKELGIIIFDEKKASFIWESFTRQFTQDRLPIYNENVIGNIFENPSLLKS